MGMMSSAMIVVVVIMMLVMAVGVFAALRRRPSGERRRVTREPQDVLSERYARGEIDDEEYARRRRVLDEQL